MFRMRASIWCQVVLAVGLCGAAPGGVASAAWLAPSGALPPDGPQPPASAVPVGPPSTEPAPRPEPDPAAEPSSPTVQVPVAPFSSVAEAPGSAQRPVLDAAASSSSSTAPASRARPRLSAGVGMGVSLDRTGLVGSRTVPVPAFQVQLGFGDGFLGVEVRLFATQASGRYHQRPADGGPPDMPADRLALDALVAVRPFAPRLPESLRWIDRSLRMVTINLGLAAENASVGAPSAIRVGPVLGGHIDLPLSPATAASTLALRVTARKMIAGDRQASDTVTISDTALDLLGGLSVTF